MPYKNIIIGIIFMLTVSVAAIVTLSYSPGNSPRTKTREYPDAFMENVSALILDKDGKLYMKIVTPKMIHFQNGDMTDFIDPQLTLYRRSPQPWFIQSRFAKARQGIDNVLFRDDVTIHHPADMNNPATVIKTKTLTVHPHDQTAETSDLITMIQPNSTIKAVGMFADMNSGNIKLLSQAQGEYVPNS
jgi:lipopolysaccharide export system protein LptC